MDWMNQLGGLLGQYAGAQPQQAAQMPQVHQDFAQVVQHAPPQAISNGLASAFRSPQTPPFAQMAAQLFGGSSPQQRASLVNTLVAAAGPTVISQLMSRGMGGASPLGGLMGMLGAQGGNAPQAQMPQISAEQAQQIPPQAIEELAAHAEQHNPSIIEQVSNFYAQQPALVKGLGAAALVAVLAKMASRD